MAAPPIMSGRSVPYRTKNNGFLPTQVGNGSLQLWLDSADININGSKPVEGQVLTSWNDKSVKANSVTAGSIQPIYQNGAVYFSGGAGFTTKLSDTVVNETIFIVVKYSGSLNQSLLYPDSTGGRLLSINNNTLVTQPLGSDINLSYGTTSASNINLVSSVKDSSSIWHYIDGLNVATTNVSSYSGLSFTYLGTDNYVGATSLTGTIYEVILYSSVLTSIERQNVESYLAWKWNLKAKTFIPTQISGLDLWLDSGDLAQDGTNVLTWPDKSPSARSITNGVLIPTTTISGVNFNNGSGFNTDYLPTYTHDETLFIVFQYSGSTASVQNILYSTDTNGRRIGILNNTLQTTCSLGTLTSGTTTTNSVVLITTRNTYSSTLFEQFVNGTFAASSGTIKYSGTTNMEIGTDNYIGTNGLKGYISEIIIYNTSLSDTNRMNVEKYLARKWSINSVLTSVLPTSITDIQLWLDATDVNGNGTRMSNNNLITTWANKSSTGITITQSTNSNKPSYLNNGIVFRGSQGFTTTYSGTSAETVFAVVTYTSLDPMNILYPTISGNRTLYIQNSLLNTIIAPSKGLSNGTIVQSNTTVFTTVNDTIQIYHYINGNSNTGGDSTTYTQTGTTLIGIDTTSRGGLVGTINELIIYSKALSDSDRKTIEAYLTTKWIPSPSNLPTSHPYYYNNVSPNTSYILSPLPRTLNGSTTFNSNNYPLISNKFHKTLGATYKQFP